MKINKEAKIGFIVTLVIALFIWGLNFLKGKNFFTRTYIYYAVYKNVGGLKEAGAISINGYKVGKIDDMYFKKGNSREIVVKLAIEEQLQIPKGSTAKIYSVDFLGTKGINLLMSNKTEYYKEWDTLPSQFEGSVADQIQEQVIPIKNKAEDLLVSIDSILNDIHKSFDYDTRKNIKESFINIKNTTVTLDENVGAIMLNLRLVSETLKKNDKAFDAVIANLAGVTDSLQQTRIKTTVDKLNATLSQTNEIMAKINKGEGTIGQLVNNDSLYQNLQNTSKNLDLLIRDLKENPKNYVHFSVFGGKSAKK